MAVLGRSVDELEVDGLEVRATNRGVQSLAKSDHALLGTDNTALNQEPVLVDLTVVGEASNGGDSLLSEILVGGSGVVDSLGTNTKNALVDFGSVEVTLLTSTCNTDVHTGRMPCTNARNLAQTTVGLSGETSDTPTGDHTLETLTFASTADIHGFTLGENVGHRYLLLEKALGIVNLVGNGTTVDLDFGQVSSLLSELDLADLGVCQHAHDGGIVLNALQLGSNFLGLLSNLLGVLGECLSLGVVPVLVESASDLIGQVTSPNGGEGTETVGGGYIANNTNDDHGRSLQNGNSLNSILLVELRSGTVNLAHNVSHTSLESHESGQMAWLGGIISGVRANLTSVVLSALLGGKLQRAAAGMFEFTVRHVY